VLGERLELKSIMPPEAVLENLGSTLDVRRLGLITDSSGGREFIGWVKAPKFQVRQKHRFASINRYKPTAVGTVEPDGRGSILRARFRADPWYRLAFLLIAGVLLTSSFQVSVGLGEAAVIALLVGITLYQIELAKEPIRSLLREVTSEPARSLHWVMSK